MLMELQEVFFLVCRGHTKRTYKAIAIPIVSQIGLKLKKATSKSQMMLWVECIVRVIRQVQNSLMLDDLKNGVSFGKAFLNHVNDEGFPADDMNYTLALLGAGTLKANPYIP